MKERLKFHVWGMIRYCILLACIFGLWWFFRTYELFLMMVLIMLFLPFSAFMLWRCRDFFSIQVVLPATGIGKDRQVPLTIRTQCKSRWLGFAAEMTYCVRNVFTEFEQTTKERIWVSPGTNVALEKMLVSHHMGRVEASVTQFQVKDWLGICSLRDARPKSGWVIVGPTRVEALPDDLTASIEDFPDENETKKRGTDINPDYEIREYIPGDDLKNIHWKLTAKTGRTMVRERLATGREKINVLLALTKDPTENDALMASLHGLGLLLLDKGYPIRLCWLGQGNALQGHYLAEEGELANAIDEILSVSGMQEQGMAQTVMEAEYPGEAYVIVKKGTYKGTYIR